MVIFKTLGHLVEGFVFTYIGLIFITYRQYAWSIQLITVMFFITVLTRAIGTIGVFYLFNSCCGSANDQPLSLNEVTLIFYSGLMKGAIAFGLVLRIDDTYANRDVIVTTSVSLIIVTSIVFGSTSGFMARYLLSKQSNKKTAVEKENEVPLLGEN